MRLLTRRFVLSLFALCICYLWVVSLAVAQDPTLPPADSAPPTADNPAPANINPYPRYRITNQFLGEGRSFDTYSTGDNDPFMGTTADVSGQFWKIAPYPPFAGTVFIDPDIITSSDPTLFQSATYSEQGMRTMFDRLRAMHLPSKRYSCPWWRNSRKTTFVEEKPCFLNHSMAKSSTSSPNRHKRDMRRC